MTTKPKLNPHSMLRAIDPPRDSPPRRWKCVYCGIVGLVEDLQKIACTYVYPPCEACGQAPECASDCPGMATALGMPGVHVIGGTDRYAAAGKPQPSPSTVCKGKCEGMGCYPTKDKKEWPPGAVPDEIGYVFVNCRVCGGTGRANAAS